MAQAPVSIKEYGIPEGGRFGDPRPNGRKHRGVDILTPIGTALKATRNGKIRRIYKTATGGLTLEIISPGETAISRYLHLSKTNKRVDDKVIEGSTTVAYSGNSGTSSQGAHVHMEEDQNGVAVDPLKVWDKEEEMVTMTGLNVIYRFLLGESVSDYGKSHYLDKVTFNEAYKSVMESNKYKSLVAQGEANPRRHLPKDLR